MQPSINFKNENDLLERIDYLNATLEWHLQPNQSMAGRVLRKAHGVPSLDYIESIMSSNFDLIAKSNNSKLFEKLEILEINTLKIHKDGETRAINDIIERVKSAANTRILTEVETGLLANVQSGTYPAFRRNAQGKIENPEEQLIQFRQMIAKGLGERVKEWNLQKTSDLIDAAEHVADLSFFHAFGGFFKRMQAAVPYNEEMLIKGRAWFKEHYADPIKAKDWLKTHPKAKEHRFPDFISLEIPARIVVPPEVAYVHHSHVNFTKEIYTLPPQLAHNREIRSLVIEHWAGKHFPEEICSLPLHFLLFASDPHVLTMQAPWARLKDTLSILNLSGLKVSQLPKHFYGLTNLISLFLDNTALKRLDAALGDLQNLSHLEISNSPFLQTLPPEIGRLSKLKEFLCTHTDLRTLPRQIGSLVQLEKLDLHDNTALRMLPPELGQLVHLRSLNCSGCDLQALPHEIGGLHELEELNLHNNPELKALPFKIDQLFQLKNLSVSKCGLTTLPKETGNLTALEKIDIRGNPISDLPAEMGSLRNLKWILCDEETLRQLPAELKQCSELVQIGHFWRKESNIPLAVFLEQYQSKP